MSLKLLSKAGQGLASTLLLAVLLFGLGGLALGQSSADTVWFEDALPAGANALGDEPWSWVSSNPTPYAGVLASKSVAQAGAHQHYFEGATTTLAINANDSLFVYVYLDVANPPSEVMLQWNDGSWDHRAYWGVNLIPWGADGTVARHAMGPLPAIGQWVRLEVPSSAVGLEGRSVSGMALTLYDGQATWDHAGKSSNSSQQNQTIAFSPISSQSLSIGSVSATATASSGLPVTLASLTPSVCSVSGTTISFVAAGICTVQASQAGNASYSAAGNVSQSFTITAQNQPALVNGSFETPVLTPGPGPSGYSYGTTGATWEFVGEAGIAANGSDFTSGNPNAPDGVQVAFVQRLGIVRQQITLGAGSYTLTFKAAQRATYQSGVQSIRVKVNNSQVGPDFSPPGTIYTQSQPFTFTVNTAGTQILEFSGVGSGADDTAFIDAVTITSQTLQNQTITFDVIGSQALSSGSVNAAATASSGLPVTLASQTTSVCSVGGTTISLLTAGTCTIQASQGGNASYSAATNVSQSFAVIGQQAQTITFAPIGGQLLSNGSVTAAASASSGLPVTLASLTTSVCTISGTTISLLATGTCTIQASQAGNASYIVALNVSQSFAVTAATLPALVNGSFETPALTPGPGGYSYGTSGATWNFVGEAGIATNGSDFTSGNTNAPDGLQVAFIQRAGAASQVVTLAAGSYAVALKAAQRANWQSGAQSLRVSMNGIQLGSDFQPPGTTYVPSPTYTFTVATAGAQTLQIAGVGSGSDYTAFIDAVTITPQSFQSQTITFGVIGSQLLSSGSVSAIATASSGLPVTLTSLTAPVCSVSGTTISLLAAGTCTVQASQGGNASYSAATNVSQSFAVIGQQAQTITFTPIANQQLSSGSVAAMATASSGLPVTLSSLTTSVCSVSGTTISFFTSGTCTIQSSQAGNAGYSAAASVSQSFAVTGQASTALINGSFETPPVGTGASAYVHAPSGASWIFSETGPAPTAGGIAGNGSDYSSGNPNAPDGVQVGYLQGAAKASQTFTLAAGAYTVSFVAAQRATWQSGVQAIRVSLNGSQLGELFQPPGIAYSQSPTYTFTVATSGPQILEFAGVGSGSDYTALIDAVTVASQTLQSQTITFGVIGSQALSSGSVNASATASSGLPVTLASLTASVCSVSGTTITLVALGTCTIQATQGGNASYSPAANAIQSFAVTASQQGQTITFSAIGGQLLSNGSTTATVSASSGLPVTLTSLTTSVCNVSATTVSLLAVGTCTIQAAQAGNASYSVAPNVSQSFAVTSTVSQAITFAPISNQKLTSAPVATFASSSSRLPVSITSATPSVCTVAGTSVTPVTLGTCTLNANQAGNATYAAAPTVAQSFAVGKGDQVISGFNPPASFQLGSSVVNFPIGIYGVALSATPGASNNPVIFTATTLDPGQNFGLSTCTLKTSGGASYADVSGGASGVCRVTVSQAGNASYDAAPTLTADIVVVAQSQAITFPAISPIAFGASPTPVSQVAPVSCGNSGCVGNLTYSTSTPAVCSITLNASNNQILNFVNVGTCTLVASLSGSVGTASAQASRSFNITAGAMSPQVISFTPASPVAYAAGSTFTLTATGGASGNPVTLSASPSSVCTVASNLVTVVEPGTCTVVASQAGNATYAPAISVTASIVVNQPLARPPTIVTPVLPQAVLGQPYQQGIVLGGNLPISDATVVSGLPDGLQASANANGYISITGTPTTSGFFALNGLATSAATGSQPQAGPTGSFAASISVKDVVTSGLTVAAGYGHTCVLRNGGVKCWGDNSAGQLGNNTAIVSSQSPVVAIAEGSGATGLSVGSGSNHTCAIVAGSLQCWGNNFKGQLGSGDTVSKNHPILILAAGGGVTAVSVGSNHTCAVISGGVSCWGDNSAGQLGDGTRTSHLTPNPVSGLPAGSGALSVAAGDTETCALIADGVKCWGGNWSFVPAVKIAAGLGVTAIAAGMRGNCAISTGYVPKCWTGSDSPATFGYVVYDSLSVGYGHICGLVNGGIGCWGGDNFLGQLGSGSNRNIGNSLAIAFGSDATQVSVGGTHTCAIVKGSVECWGANGSATTLGADYPTVDFTPAVAIAPGSKATEVSTSNGTTCAVVDGGLSCWGYEKAFNNTCGAFDALSTPLAIAASGSGVTDVSVSRAASGVCVVAAAGLTCYEGLYGSGAHTSNPLAAFTGVTAVGASTHTCAVVSGGVQCYGKNDHGQLGNGSLTASPTPVTAIALGSGATSVSTGDSHTCAVVASGVRCWGSNANGQLGTGSTTDSNVPVPIPNSSGATSVGAGSAHTCAAMNGGVKCWGAGAQGQLGNGGATQSLVPVIAVPVGSGATRVAAGTQHSCAIVDGGVQCWGASPLGQLGNGSMTPSRSPVQAIPAGSNVTAISASSSNTCVVENGGVLCWGDNISGATGNLSSYTFRKVFADVLASGTASAPTIGSPTSGPGSVTFQVIAPTNSGGSPVTSYTATCSAAGYATISTTVDASASSITVSGLDQGVAYACSAAAGNAAGNGASSTTVAITPAATPTSATITSPAPFAAFAAPASITVTAVARASQGASITKVDFYQDNGTFIGTSTTPPYSVPWSAPSPGTFALTAIATDSVGATGSSAPVSVTLTLAGEAITYLHNDFAGSPIAATDSSGAILWRAAYQPFGSEIRKEAASISNRQLFTGKPFDADTGLSYFGARYYDPVVGRFMGIDPAGFSDGNVHSFNRFGYANQNPYRFVDPDGREPWQWVDRQNPKGTFFRSAGESIGALAAYAEGIATGNNFLAQAALDGMRENVSTSDGIQAASMLAIGARRGREPPNFDVSRQAAFAKAGMTDPAKIQFSKMDPKTGTVVEFKGEAGAKVGYDGPHSTPGPNHDTQHISWQSGGKRGADGRNRGNEPYSGPQHPSRSDRKEQ